MAQMNMIEAIRSALDVLMAEGGFPDLLREAVLAATRRSRELAE